MYHTIGALLQPSPAFAEFVRGSGDAERQAVFEDVVFGTLGGGRVGWGRHELQLAWDFRTGSWENGPGRIEHMIRDSRERLESGRTTPQFEITDVVPERCGDRAPARQEESGGRQVWGWLAVPSYLTAPGPGHELLRVLSGGVPVANGNVERVQFAAYIPCSVFGAARDKHGFIRSQEAGGAHVARIIQFGHGFLGTRNEGMWEMQALAEEAQALVWAIDWGGLSRFDLLPMAKLVLADLGKFPLVPAQLSQSFTNGACSLWYLRSLLRLDPAFSLDPHETVPAKRGGEGRAGSKGVGGERVGGGGGGRKEGSSEAGDRESGGREGPKTGVEGIDAIAGRAESSSVPGGRKGARARAAGNEQRNGRGSGAPKAQSSSEHLIAIDTPIIYHGISLGGVLGAGYVLSSPYISRYACFSCSDSFRGSHTTELISYTYTHPPPSPAPTLTPHLAPHPHSPPT